MALDHPLSRSRRRPYNVGSELDLSVADLARAVAAHVNPSAQVRIAKAPSPGSTPERYVPSTARARTELSLRQTVPLGEALLRTAAWHRLQTPTAIRRRSVA